MDHTNQGKNSWKGNVCREGRTVTVDGIFNGTELECAVGVGAERYEPVGKLVHGDDRVLSVYCSGVDDGILGGLWNNNRIDNFHEIISLKENERNINTF